VVNFYQAQSGTKLKKIIRWSQHYGSGVIFTNKQ
jgi:hypothetical protein